MTKTRNKNKKEQKQIWSWNVKLQNTWYYTHVNSAGWREILYVTPVLAASTRIVMGDVELELDGKDVIFVYPIIAALEEEKYELSR